MYSPMDFLPNIIHQGSPFHIQIKMSLEVAKSDKSKSFFQEGIHKRGIQGFF